MPSRASRRTLLMAGAAAPLGACAETPDPRSRLTGEGGDALLTNAVVFDGERFTDHDSVAVRGGFVAEVGQGLSRADLPVFDCGSRVLLPGLIDAHTHASGEHAPSAIRFGVTTLLDMHGPIQPGFDAYRNSLDERLRSDVRWSGWGVTVPKGHPTQLSPLTPTVADFDGVADFVAARVDDGADHIKIFIQTEGRPATLDPGQVAEAVEAAHAHGRLAVAHVGHWGDARTAVEAGMDVLVHLPIGPAVDHDVVEALAAGPTPVVATMHVLTTGRCDHDYSAFLEADHPVADRLDYMQRSDAQSGPQVCDTATPDYIAEHRTPPEESVTALRDAGVPLLVGTDLGNPGTVAGLSVLVEMRMLADIGLGAEEVLSGATARTADAFGLADRGRIAPERRADMLLLETDDPDEAVGAYEVAAVWKNGHEVALDTR